MSVVELVNLVKSVLLILGLIADFLISHTANLNLFIGLLFRLSVLHNNNSKNKEKVFLLVILCVRES